jgi:hypothetical protein
MKLFYIFLFLTNINLLAQTAEVNPYTPTGQDEAMLKSYTQKYFELSKIKDIDGLLDEIHPGLFSVAPRSLIKQQLEEGINGDIVHIDFTEMDYMGVEKSLEYEGIIYFVMIYKSIFTLTFQKTEAQTDEDFEDYLTMLESMYQAQFEGDKVTRNQNSFTIDGFKKMLVVQDASLDGLKSLEIKPGMESMLKVFLPEAVVTSLYE